MKPNELKQARARLGLTQAELADALDVSIDTVGSWEQDRRTISGPVAMCIQTMIRERNTDD